MQGYEKLFIFLSAATGGIMANEFFKGLEPYMSILGGVFGLTIVEVLRYYYNKLKNHNNDTIEKKSSDKS